MDPKTTAVVLIEYQNDFTTEGGTLHGTAPLKYKGSGRRIEADD